MYSAPLTKSLICYKRNDILITLVVSEYYKYTVQEKLKYHTHFWIWSLCLLLIGVFVLTRQAAAAQPAISSDERLITVYDQGEEKTFITNKTTIGSALLTAGFSISESDDVEPAASTKLVAKNYVVNVYRARAVTVDDGNQRTQVITAAQSPRRILEQVGSKLYDEDQTKFELASSPLDDGGAGLRMSVDRATPFMFTLYGKTFEARTQATTVGEMLREKNIALGENDGKSTADETPLVKGMSVAVWRNGKQTVTVEEAIVKPIEEVKDADREKGFKEVRTAGTDGKKNVTYEIEVRDGKEIGRKAIASVTTLEPVKEVVVIGTKVRGAFTTPSQNESITWDYLLAQGFSRNQTAGIMGNLKQEHGFNTSGDGIAQWTGGRKAALMSRPDPYNIYTQLDFLMHELNGGYASVRDAIKASSTVEQAVTIFQDRFERCGVCAESRRVQFAYDILASH